MKRQHRVVGMLALLGPAFSFFPIAPSKFPLGRLAIGSVHASADQDRTLVVSVHVVDRVGIELLAPVAGEVLLWHGRGGGVPKRVDSDRTVDPIAFAGTRMGSGLDDEPDRRGHFATPRRADPAPLRLAGIVLSVWFPGSDLGCGVVRLVS